jgi:hypothetical protein
MQLIGTFEEFVKFVDDTGFMTLSANPIGFPALWAATDEDKWFTGLDDDPWQWRIRIVEERHAAYAKLFHRQPSFVSKEWYPYFLAVRRGQRTFGDAYEMGLMSAEARRIYELFDSRSILALHEIRRLGGFTGKPQGKFESALTALQTGMFITVSGMTRMTTLDGRPHSWPVTEYRRVEDWAWEGTMERAGKINQAEALERISGRIHEALPGADKNRVSRFIGV